MENIKTKMQHLLSLVGTPYQMFDENGYYLGCFRPVYELYPGKPRYKLRSNNDDKNFWYGIAKIRKHCAEITQEELQEGDIIATRFRDELHIAVYYQDGKIIHVFKDHTLQLGRLKMFKDFQCFRVK